MVIGIVIYQFDVNQDNTGEIEPEFLKVCEEMASNYEGPSVSSYISTEEQFRLFFSHTTGLKRQNKGRIITNIKLGKFLNTKHQYFSYYHHSEIEKQYITLCLFDTDQYMELYEPTLQFMTKTLGPLFETITEETFRKAQSINIITRRLSNVLKGTLFQVEHLENLTKMQKAALIYASSERQQCFKVLREGPISRTNFTNRLKKSWPKANIEMLLNPFIELNLVKREWLHANLRNPRKTNEKQEEFLFLIKDFIFIRKPPKHLYKELQKNKMIRKGYEKALVEFYNNYDPFENLWEESKELATIILKPEVFELLALFQQKSYPVQKVPHVISEFGDIKNLLDYLEEKHVIARIQDVTGVFWVCLLCEITPLMVFPEYIIPKIEDRSLLKKGQIASESLYSPLRKEIGVMGLDLLKSSYYEQVKFQEVN